MVQDQTEMFLNLNHRPVCAASDASHFLLTGAATPPGQEGLWPGPPSMFLRPSATKIQRRIAYLCSRSFSSDDRRFSRARVSSLFENDSVE